MKKELKALLFLLIGLLIVAATIAGAMAFTPWIQFGNSGMTFSTAIERMNVLYYPHQVYDNIETSCNIPDTSRSGIYVDPVYGYMWLLGTGVVSVYDNQCTLLAQTSTSKTYYGGPYIIENLAGLPEIVFTTRNASNVIHVLGYSFNNATQALTQEADFGFQGCTIASGVYCDERINLCVINCNDGYIKRMDMNTLTYTDSSNAALGNQTTLAIRGTLNDYGGAANGLSGGDIDNDGHREALLWIIKNIPNYDYYVIGLYDLTNDNIQSTATVGNTAWAYTYSCGVYTNTWLWYGVSPCIMGQVGGPTSTGEVLCSFKGSNQGTGCSGSQAAHNKVFDSSLNQVYTDQGVTDTTYDTNMVSGDVDTDNVNEFCYVVNHNITCIDSNYATKIANCKIRETLDSSFAISMLQYDGTGMKDIASIMGIYDVSGQNCSIIYNFGNDLNVTSTRKGWFVPADVNGDVAPDLLYADSGVSYLFSTFICYENWACDPWGQCQPNEEQYRTCYDVNNCGTEEFKPSEVQSCICEDWSCTPWSDCYLNLMTRVCTDNNECGTELHKPVEQQACNCTEDWSCTDWGICTNFNQTRVCTDANNCGTEYNKPDEIQYCCEESWSCGSWSACTSGQKTRSCSDLNDCGTYEFQPATIQNCTSGGGGGGGAWPDDEPVVPITNTTVPIIQEEQPDLLAGIKDGLASITGLVSFQGVNGFATKAGDYIKANPMLIVELIAGGAVIYFLARPKKPRVRRK